MSKNHEKRTFYRFAFTALLVVLLVALFMIVFLRQKSTRHLSATVKELLATQTNISAIDEVVQDLYKAENYFRLYTLTHTREDYRQYVQQLQKISFRLDSIESKHQEEEQLQQLLNEKQEKTAVFIRVRHYADSLLSLSLQWDSVYNANAYVQNAHPLPHLKERTDTVVAEYEETQKSRKKLLGRIRDAIWNKPEDKQVKREITIIKTAQDSSGTPQGRAKAQLQQIKDYYDKLHSKEYEMIMANVQLFDELDKLLGTLKNQEQQIASKRQTLLSQHFNNTLQKMDAGIWCRCANMRC